MSSTIDANKNINTSASQIQSNLQRSQSFHTSLLRPIEDVKEQKQLNNPEEDTTIKISNKNENRNSDKTSENNNPTISNENIKNTDEIKTPVEIDDHNRTMVLQVDRTDLRLISPDRKVILLHKHHKDVCSCLQVSLLLNRE